MDRMRNQINKETTLALLQQQANQNAEQLSIDRQREDRIRQEAQEREDNIRREQEARNQQGSQIWSDVNSKLDGMKKDLYDVKDQGNTLLKEQHKVSDAIAPLTGMKPPQRRPRGTPKSVSPHVQDDSPQKIGASKCTPMILDDKFKSNKTFDSEDNSNLSPASWDKSKPSPASKETLAPASHFRKEYVLDPAGIHYSQLKLAPDNRPSGEGKANLLPTSKDTWADYSQSAKESDLKLKQGAASKDTWAASSESKRESDHDPPDDPSSQLLLSPRDYPIKKETWAAASLSSKESGADLTGAPSSQLLHSP